MAAVRKGNWRVCLNDHISIKKTTAKSGWRGYGSRSAFEICDAARLTGMPKTGAWRWRRAEVGPIGKSQARDVSEVRPEPQAGA